MIVITNSYNLLHCPYEAFSFSEILVCIRGRTISSYMGTGSPDAEVGGDFPLFFLGTSNPISTPHVNTTAMTTSRDMATPTTPAAFRASRTSGDDIVSIVAINMYTKQ